MHATFEPSTDMAYVYLTGPGESNRVAHMKALIIDLPSGARRLLNLDFDAAGRLVGIEVSGASVSLPESLVEAAQRPSRARPGLR